MSSTAQGQRLTQQHQAAQLAIRASIVRQLTAAWAAFDPADIAGSWGRIEPLLLALAENGRALSSGVAGTYYTGFRAAEGVSGSVAIARPGTEWRAAAEASFKVTGPATAHRLLAMHRPDVAQQTLVSVAGALGRIVTDGGRETILGTMRNDVRALGWFRVTAGEPCAFCAMLASRGPVFRTRESASFPAHDFCMCVAEPQFVRNAEWPGQARQYQEMWNETTRGLSGAEARLAFRRAYEGRA